MKSDVSRNGDEIRSRCLWRDESQTPAGGRSLQSVLIYGTVALFMCLYLYVCVRACGIIFPVICAVQCCLECEAWKYCTGPSARSPVLKTWDFNVFRHGFAVKQTHILALARAHCNAHPHIFRFKCAISQFMAVFIRLLFRFCFCH